ncbi:MAG TPA: hypothetical protein VJI66_02340 [Candidatus Paceibacterota bacterium]
MKKIIILIIVLAIAGAVVWRFNNKDIKIGGSINPNATSTESVPVTQTVVVSNKISEYKNDELGFSVKYPTAWGRGDAPSSVTFLIPTPTNKVKNTIGNLQAKIDVVSGKCSFPPVTTVSERNTMVEGNLTFNMISIANTVQGRSYFNRIYTLQKDSICYYFTFTAVTLSPASKGFVGADIQKVGAENKTLVDTADAQFKDMVKSFKFVVGPAGKDETQVVPKK